ncbi:MAG: hypothetical protein C0394_09440, partial [Syntrophus sp. (in: bacteria)]|nr:hypothetical protein [Syntrophus sp. (in: bacteria)]
SIQAEGIAPDIAIKYQRPVQEKEGAEERVRERDLKGHIKSPEENGQKPEDRTKPEEKAKKDADDPALDNQLKSAIDILKSWDIFRKTVGS